MPSQRRRRATHREPKHRIPDRNKEPTDMTTMKTIGATTERVSSRMMTNIKIPHASVIAWYGSAQSIPSSVLIGTRAAITVWTQRSGFSARYIQFPWGNYDDLFCLQSPKAALHGLHDMTSLLDTILLFLCVFRTFFGHVMLVITWYSICRQSLPDPE
jgi:hypothetical protein